MSWRCVASVALLLAWQGAPAAQATPGTCGEGAVLQRLSAAGDITLAFAAQPQPIRVGQHFVLQIWLCAPQGVDATLTRVDADMPAHRHGMNYRVTLEAQAGQRWRASGLMFHMPGRWRLQFDLSSAGRTQRLEHLLDLE